MNYYPEDLNSSDETSDLLEAYLAFEAACGIHDEAEKTLEISAEIKRLEERASDFNLCRQPNWALSPERQGIYARNPVIALGHLSVLMTNGYYSWRANRAKRKADELSRRLYEE